MGTHPDVSKNRVKETPCYVPTDSPLALASRFLWNFSSSSLFFCS